MARQYVLETKWVFDHYETEFCTFTFEANDDYNLELLFKPAGDPTLTACLMKMVKQLCELQNGNWMEWDNCKPVAVYRVVNNSGQIRPPGIPEIHMGRPPQFVLKFHLELIGRFDEKGRPIVNMPQELTDLHKL